MSNKEAIKMIVSPLCLFLKLELEKCMENNDECDTATKYLLEICLKTMILMGEISEDEIKNSLRIKKS